MKEEDSKPEADRGPHPFTHKTLTYIARTREENEPFVLDPWNENLPLKAKMDAKVMFKNPKNERQINDTHTKATVYESNVKSAYLPFSHV
mmetsp:Transcript_27155/g.53348  ORF Transcript_27155/g.53348 Transcript_27155/m.53348 type:complete len:90 (-) Transcript_27155:142-411(-)